MSGLIDQRHQRRGQTVAGDLERVRADQMTEKNRGWHEVVPGHFQKPLHRNTHTHTHTELLHSGSKRVFDKAARSAQDQSVDARCRTFQRSRLENIAASLKFKICAENSFACLGYAEFRYRVATCGA